MTVKAAVQKRKEIALLALPYLVAIVLVLQIVTTTHFSPAVLILDVLVSFQVC